MKIRKMTVKDFSKAYSLWEKTNLGVKSLAVEKKELTQTIKFNPNICFVVEEDDRIIGTLLGDFNGRRGFIHRLAIDPNYQHKGYGSILLSKVQKALKKAGADTVLLWVDCANLNVLPLRLDKNPSLLRKALV